MYRSFITEINQNFLNGTRSTNQMFFLLYTKFGKQFVTERIKELIILIDYEPFNEINLNHLEKKIVKYLCEDSDIQNILSSSKYIDGTHRISVVDRKKTLEKLYLLAYIGKVNKENGQIIVTHDFYREDQIKPKTLTISSFRRLQKLKDEVGRRGEDYIYQLELNRLPGMPVKRVSDTDVGAGFDILTFREPFDLSRANQLMLEVKTFKDSYHFFVSNNEYQTHIEHKGSHNFIIVRENHNGGHEVFQIIKDLIEFMEMNPHIITLIPTWKVTLG